MNSRTLRPAFTHPPLPVRSSLRTCIQPLCPRYPHGPLRIRRQAVCPGPVATASPPTKTSVESQVDTLLLFIRDTDLGASASPVERSTIRSIIDELVNTLPKPQLRADPRIYGDYAVVYTDSSPSERAPPVGGLLRSRLGRFLFRTSCIAQLLDAPNSVINILCFRFLGLIDGAVGFRGRLTLEPDSAQGVVRSEFDRPVLKIGPAVFQYGPRPTVNNNVRYIDDRIRISVGRRGSIVVFERKPQQEMEAVRKATTMFDAKPLPTIVLPLIGMAGIAAAFMVSSIWVRVAVVAFVAAMVYLLRRNGTLRDPPNEPKDAGRDVKSTTP